MKIKNLGIIHDFDSVKKEIMNNINSEEKNSMFCYGLNKLKVILASKTDDDIYKDKIPPDVNIIKRNWRSEGGSVYLEDNLLLGLRHKREGEYFYSLYSFLEFYFQQYNIEVTIQGNDIVIENEKICGVDSFKDFEYNTIELCMINLSQNINAKLEIYLKNIKYKVNYLSKYIKLDDDSLLKDIGDKFEIYCKDNAFKNLI
jgi:hypothetical protein